MTRILLVEDEKTAIDAFCELLRGLPGSPVPAIARSRDSAVAQLHESFFDLMILDLKIPTTDTSESLAPEYGFDVFGVAREVAPGMPVYLVTGSSVEAFVVELLKNKQEVDIWSSGKISTVSVTKKLELDELERNLLPFVRGPHLLADVELEKNGTNLEVQEERLLRIFAKRFQGARCIVRELKGGLSGARVFSLQVFNPAGGIIHNSIAKVSSLDEVRNEKQRYEQYIHRLPPGVTPRMLTCLEFGGKATAAIFYGLADGHDSSFFRFALQQPVQCATAVEAVSNGLSSWRKAAGEERRSVVDIRRLQIEDGIRAAVLERFPIPWSDDFESRQVQTRWGCIHGDFHGLNVLLTDAGVPAIIDYGDISEGPLCHDPITLEFSLLFHPASLVAHGEWPTIDAARDWFNLDDYVRGCPCEDYVRACRNWAINAAVGRRDLAAVAYSYFLRQLKFEKTNKDLALAFLEGSKCLWEST